MTSLSKGVVRGARAGAAGTTALNLATNADMAVRGRPASRVPQSVVSEGAERIGAPVPGSIPTRRNRLDGLGAVAGAANGLAVGALAGALRAAGVRLPAALGAPLLGAASMAATDLPIARLGVSDPRRWSGRDWAADAVPHLVYGVVTHATLVAQDGGDAGGDLRSPSAADLVRAASVGAATGCRSSLGVTALAWRSTTGDDGPAGRLAGRTGRTLLGLLAVAELGADKHPSVPDRVGAPGLAPRVALGAASSGATARRDGVESGVPALVGAVSAVGAAVAGMRARSVARRRFGSDLPGALVEDTVAALLAWAGTRGQRR